MGRDISPVAATPSGRQKGIVPNRRSAQFGVYNGRLLSALDKLLRDKPLYIGELSTSINDALLAVDLNTVERVTLQSSQKQTAIATPTALRNQHRIRIHPYHYDTKRRLHQIA